MCKIINGVGRPKRIIKTDQVPSMIALQHELRKEFWSEILELVNSVKNVKEDGSDIMDHVPGGPGGVVILEKFPCWRITSKRFS